jgi:hypothetical protein
MAVLTSSRVPDISVFTTASDAAQQAAINPLGTLQALAMHERERQAANGVPTAGLAGIVVTQERTFVETTGAGVYTGSITVPAGATIKDIQIRSTVLWTATTSALMDVGDVATAAGWYSQINLKATDLLVGEVIRFSSTGGKEGTYLVTATGALNASFNAAAVVISGVITTVGAAGLAGRTRMLVEYSLPGTAAAAKV